MIANIVKHSSKCSLLSHLRPITYESGDFITNRLQRRNVRLREVKGLADSPTEKPVQQSLNLAQVNLAPLLLLLSTLYPSSFVAHIIRNDSQHYLSYFHIPPRVNAFNIAPLNIPYLCIHLLSSSCAYPDLFSVSLVL